MNKIKNLFTILKSAVLLMSLMFSNPFTIQQAFSTTECSKSSGCTVQCSTSNCTKDSDRCTCVTSCNPNANNNNCAKATTISCTTKQIASCVTSTTTTAGGICKCVAAPPLSNGTCSKDSDCINGNHCYNANNGGKGTCIPNTQCTATDFNHCSHGADPVNNLPISPTCENINQNTGLGTCGYQANFPVDNGISSPYYQNCYSSSDCDGCDKYAYNYDKQTQKGYGHCIGANQNKFISGRCQCNYVCLTKRDCPCPQGTSPICSSANINENGTCSCVTK